MSNAKKFVFLTLILISMVSASDWPMYRHDLNHTGRTTDLGPLTNDILWTFTTNWAVHSSPAVSNGVIYIGSSDDNVYALNASTGIKIWTYITGGSVMSSPAVSNGVIYIGSHDNKTYALNASTGEHIWNYTTGNYVTSSPAVSNGVVYIGSHDRKIYAFGLQFMMTCILIQIQRFYQALII